MARIAREVAMPRWQREARLGAVVEQHGFPIKRVVTTATVRTEASLMRIVRLMAGIAVAAAQTREVVTAMAGLAVQSFMAADKRESGQCHMIEGELCPCRRAVTVRTFWSVASLVHIVLLMAVVTGLPHIGKVLAAMTVVASSLGMCARQGKAGRTMIERCCRPGLRRMAGAAVVAEGACMNVVLAVTGSTFDRRFAVFFAVGMAAVTGGRRVRAQEGEICQRMIEIRLVEIDNIDITPFVFGMAACAFPLCRIRQTTVKSSLPVDIGPDIHMARDAETVLRLLRQPRMTSSAICFEFGVTGNDRAGHDQPLLDLGRWRALRRCKQRQDEHAEDGNDFAIRNAILHQYR